MTYTPLPAQRGGGGGGERGFKGLMNETCMTNKQNNVTFMYVSIYFSMIIVTLLIRISLP